VGEGWEAYAGILLRELSSRQESAGPMLVALEGNLAIDWHSLRMRTGLAMKKAGFACELMDVASCMKNERETERVISTFLEPDEPIFGRICKEDIAILFHEKKLRAMAGRVEAVVGKAKSPQRPKVVVCCGSGATLLPLKRPFDLVFYFDITREEALKRNKSWTKRISKTQSISPRRVYYVDFPVHERHRKRIFHLIDFYIDANDRKAPKVISRDSLLSLLDALCRTPFRVKPLYEPGVWGGQWLKRNRGLPKTMVNCAYGFEIIAPEQSVLVRCGAKVLDLPFNLIMERAGRKIMGARAVRRFGDLLPIRFAYDDTWEGGNLSIQAHPTTSYMKARFGEPMHQAEMYYVFEAKPESIIHLGLVNGVDRKAFYRQAKSSEEKRFPFDHRRFVNAVPATKGEILLIPPGTVHGAGADELILEISSTPYRYTFKIYDYCRPDLDGSFRPIHIDHAFKVVKFFRTARWVSKNLKQKPRLLRAGGGKGTKWREFVIADRREFHHVVHRIEFAKMYADDTGGKFHMLNLVEGESVTISPRNGESAGRRMALSETLLVPQAVGAYEVRNDGKGPCKVVKAFLRA
jgi:mannose-6-phosphate isomerase class I